MRFLMITIKRKSIPYKNSLREATNEMMLKRRLYISEAPMFGEWLKRHGGRLITGWDIEFDNHEDATAFILKYGHNKQQITQV